MEFRVLKYGGRGRFKTCPYVAVVIFAILFIAQITFAAPLSIEGNFHGIFDNLENKFGAEGSGTVFGANADLSVGFLPSRNSGVFIGVNFFQQYGDENTGDGFSPIMSFRFQDDINNFVFGTMPRSLLINYHDYILSKHWQFQNPVFQGLFFEQDFGALNWAVWADWVGMQSENTRERFIHGHNLTGTFILNDQSYLLLGYQFIYDHIALRSGVGHGDHVEDVGAFVGNISYRALGEQNSRIREFRGGFRGMFRYNRQREFTKNYQISAGVEVYTGLDFGLFDIGYSHYFKVRDVVRFPYEFETGDDRFLADFGQADILVRFLDRDEAKVNFTLSFIPTDGGVNHRQTMQVVVPIRVGR
ncbi:MAG: hypothetical protein FWE23_07295 [Chitinivibrionia bacterium]|nr:hypothetical protein [Chitinivibrionia bacterium]